MRRLGHLVVALALSTTACGSDDPSAPHPPSGSGDAFELTLGDTTPTLAIPPGELEREHVYTAATNTEVVVYIEALRGTSMLRVLIDSVDVTAGTYAYEEPGQEFPHIRTDRFVIPAGKTLHVVVQRTVGDTSQRVGYRLFLYQVNRAPERGPATLTFGAVRNDEDLETNADVDEFSLAGHGGEEFVGYLAMVDSINPGNFALEFANAALPYSEQYGANAPPFGTPLEDNATGNFIVPAEGSWVVRVTSNASERPRYQFMVRRVNRAPESATAILAINSVVEESLDYTGDIDEFTVHGTAGQLVDLLMEPVSSGDLTHQLQTFGAGVPEGYAMLGRTPFEGSTGSLAIPASGNLTFRVSAPNVAPLHGRGAYRIRVVPLSVAPETASATLAAGDSVITEKIDRWADSDEFTLNWPVAGLANIFLRGTDTNPLFADLLDGSGAVLQTAARQNGTGRFNLGAGTYRIRVHGARGPFTGPYQLYAYRISEAPETGPSALTMGAVINGAIDPIGDRDVYTLNIAPGTLFTIRYTATGPESSELLAMLTAPSLAICPGCGTFWIAPGEVSAIMDAPAGDERELTIESHYLTDGSRGNYTVKVEPVNTAPEGSPSTIATGGTLTETMMTNDVDEYTLVGTPNSEIAVMVKLVQPYPLGTCAEILAPDSPARLGVTAAQEQDIGSGIIRLGSTGRARIRVWPIRYCLEEQKYRSAIPTNPGPYELQVLAVDRAPEHVAATIAPTDTVRGEDIAHPADVDEFHFSGTAGMQVRPAIYTEYALYPTATLALELVAPGGNIIATLAGDGQTLGGWFQANPVALPATGTYTVRLMTVQNLRGRGPYVFTLRP